MNWFGVALLLLGFAGCLAEVVKDFEKSRCRAFFASPNRQWSTPTTFNDNNRYKKICQTLNDDVYFATYYDTANRIPVYSAYRFTGLQDCDRRDQWFIEPQLDDPTKGGDMDCESAVTKPPLGTNQALNADYYKSGFDKGHLFPVHLATSQYCSDATFTLTNAALQNPSFNRGQWKVAEGQLGKTLEINCLNTGLSAYVVTGVVPGSNTLNNRVRVPSHFWTAFCCLDNNNVASYSGGLYQENSNMKVQYVTVPNLEKFLEENYKGRYNTDQNESFQVFGGGCRGAEKPDLEPFLQTSKRKGAHSSRRRLQDRNSRKQINCPPRRKRIGKTKVSSLF